MPLLTGVNDDGSTRGSSLIDEIGRIGARFERGHPVQGPEAVAL
jgi:hypothetical protein